MLHPIRQLCYWAASLSAMLTYTFFSASFDASAASGTPKEGILILALMAMFLCAAFHDVYILSPRKYRPREAGECLYWFFLLTVMLSLGRAARSINEAFFNGLDKHVGIRQQVIHVLLNYLFLAKMEFWKSGNDGNLAFIMIANLAYPLWDSIIPYYSLHQRFEKRVSKGGWIVFVLIDVALWLFPFAYFATLLRYLVFGDLKPCWNTDMLLSGESPMLWYSPQSAVFSVLVGAPLRLAVETIVDQLLVGCYTMRRLLREERRDGNNCSCTCAQHANDADGVVKLVQGSMRLV